MMMRLEVRPLTADRMPALFFWLTILLAVGCRPPEPNGYWTICNDSEECPAGLQCENVLQTTSLMCTITCTKDQDCPDRPGARPSVCREGLCERQDERL
jgi:hypothetical protein